MSVIAFIPARGGSKGLPGKNIKELAGKPLIAWSIEQALASSNISQVIVSTDSEEIAEIAKKHGAEVPFLRPLNLSGDEATTESAMLHFCDYAVTHGINISTLVLLQCTSPIRDVDTLDNALAYYFYNEFDSLLSVSESHRFFWKDAKSPKALYDYGNRPRRQDIKDVDRQYMETGSFYVSDFKGFLQYKNRLFGKIGMYVTSEEESYEIDSLNDFVICDALMSTTLKNKVK